MQELVRTNNAVLISAIEALLTAAGIPHVVLDQHMSVLEGSLGMLPRRIVVSDDHHAEAHRLLEDAGLAHELRTQPGLSPASSGDTTDDAVLGGRLRLLQPRKGHRVGHDAILLAAAAPVQPGDRVCDFGAGVGAAGLAVAVRHPDVRVTLFEIDSAVAALATQNIERNGLERRAEAYCADVTVWPLAEELTPLAGAMDCVIMNPPFNDAMAHQHSPDPTRARAHIDTGETLESWVKSADRLLHSAGRVAIITRADRLSGALAALSGTFGGINVVPIHGRAGRAAIRVVLTATKGSRAPLQLQQGLILTDDDGRSTDAADAILRHAGAMAASIR